MKLAEFIKMRDEIIDSDDRSCYSDKALNDLERYYHKNKDVE